MVKSFKLKRHGEKANLSSYLQEMPFYDFHVNKWNALTRHGHTKPNKEIGIANKRLYDKMKANPKAYFNFGF